MQRTSRNEGDFDLAGVLHLFLDPLGDVVGDLLGQAVVDVLGVDDHADLAAGLDGVGLLDALEGGRDAFELLEPLDVAFEALASGAGPAGADGVGGEDDGRVGAGGFDVAVVGGGGVDDLVLLAVPLQQVGPDLRVPALDLVVDGLADVVQQSPPGGRAGR